MRRTGFNRIKARASGWKTRGGCDVSECNQHDLIGRRRRRPVTRASLILIIQLISYEGLRAIISNSFTLPRGLRNAPGDQRDTSPRRLIGGGSIFLRRQNLFWYSRAPCNISQWMSSVDSRPIQLACWSRRRRRRTYCGLENAGASKQPETAQSRHRNREPETVVTTLNSASLVGGAHLLLRIGRLGWLDLGGVVR